MPRPTSLIVAALLFLSPVGAWAQEASPGMPGGQAMMMGNCCPAMAVWNGSVYVTYGTTLEKLDSRLQVEQSIALPANERGRHGMTNRATPTEGSEKEMAGSPQMMKMHQMMQMHQGAMGHPQLRVDRTGVYLFRAGRLTVYDHNLNQQASREFPLK